MGKKYLIDTNILIDFQEQIIPEKGQSLVVEIIDKEFNISIINRIEILGYKYVTLKTKTFVGLATIFELDTIVAETAIEIRKTHKIKLPDAIIAATAKVHGLTLVTHNTKDFLNIENLEVFDPYTMK